MSDWFWIIYTVHHAQFTIQNCTWYKLYRTRDHLVCIKPFFIFFAGCAAKFSSNVSTVKSWSFAAFANAAALRVCRLPICCEFRFTCIRRGVPGGRGGIIFGGGNLGITPIGNLGGPGILEGPPILGGIVILGGSGMRGGPRGCGIGGPIWGGIGGLIPILGPNLGPNLGAGGGGGGPGGIGCGGNLGPNPGWGSGPKPNLGGGNGAPFAKPRRGGPNPGGPIMNGGCGGGGLPPGWFNGGLFFPFSFLARSIVGVKVTLLVSIFRPHGVRFNSATYVCRSIGCPRASWKAKTKCYLSLVVNLFSLSLEATNIINVNKQP